MGVWELYPQKSFLYIVFKSVDFDAFDSYQQLS